MTRQTAALEETARAKVNLWLEIQGRRGDGYHQLSSLVAFADFGDEVILYPAQLSAPNPNHSPEPARLSAHIPAQARSKDHQPFGEVSNRENFSSLTITGPFSAHLSVTDNLIVSAVKVLTSRNAAKPSAGAHFELIKRLPVAAGLGGGSADAAAAIRLLARASGQSLTNVLRDRHLTASDLAALIGADVPVCLAQETVMMHGIGETLTPLTGPMAPWPAVLVNPGVPLATKDVFARLSAPTVAAEAVTTPEPVSWPPHRRDQLALLQDKTNDLEPPARALVPEIDQVLTALGVQVGCVLARLSGSGPTCFGLFESPNMARKAAQRLSEMQPKWWVKPVVIGDADRDSATLEPAV